MMGHLWLRGAVNKRCHQNCGLSRPVKSTTNHQNLLDYMYDFSYLCKTEIENGISHLISEMA